MDPATPGPRVALMYILIGRTVPVVMVIAMVFTAGCESTSKKDMGTAVGATIGSLIGYRIDDDASGALIGAAVGALVGRAIGQYMDESDRQKVSEALENAQEGETTRWHNQNTGYDHALTPTSTVYSEGDDECRTFEQEIIVDGERKLIDAVACKQAEQENWEVRT